jgi:SAM-dependent methyltransferase
VLHDDRRRASSFGDDAAQYDRARPSYPSELIDDVVAGDVRDVVDVGCGTGRVARLLAARGCRVVGVDPDERMAAVAREHTIDVEITTFEEWDDRGRRFDALTSGQAWHWVNPERGVAKAAQVLRPGGRVAVFWNLGRHTDDVTAAIRSVYEPRRPDLLDNTVALGTAQVETRGDAEPFERSDAFVNVEQREYTWKRIQKREAWLDELPTHSSHRLLAADELAALLDELRAVLPNELTTTFRTLAVFATKR